MKCLYKYPQPEFPYSQLVDVNRRRSKSECEYELMETGVFNEDRYFDIFVEYAKNEQDDILGRVTLINRGPDAADPAPIADDLVPQYLELGLWRAPARIGASGFSYYRGP